MIFYQIPVSFHLLWIIPVLICLILVTFGIGCIFMHFGVLMDDLVNLTNIGLRFMFYLSGIFYNINEKVPVRYRNILLIGNPMALLIDGFRNGLMYCTTPNLIGLGIWFVLGILLSIYGIHLIYKYENTYVKVMRG